MNRSTEWLSQRRPVAPMSLAPWLGAQREGDEPDLVEVGCDALARARANPGRIRQSAFDLLAADALLSYASEAALESDDPAGTLLAVLRRVAEAV